MNFELGIVEREHLRAHLAVEPSKLSGKQTVFVYGTDLTLANDVAVDEIPDFPRKFEERRVVMPCPDDGLPRRVFSSASDRGSWILVMGYDYVGGTSAIFGDPFSFLKDVGKDLPDLPTMTVVFSFPALISGFLSLDWLEEMFNFATKQFVSMCGIAAR